jgi:branched-chain amino acid transport system substrate-binding protein
MLRGVQIVSEGPFERNTTAVRASLLAIRRGNPQAVIMVGPYQPIAEFVRLARRIKFDPVLLAVSFVDADALAAELGADGNGIVITQVVPFPGDDSSPLISRYRAALRLVAAEVQPGFISLEGYIVGRFVIDILQGLGPNPTRAGLLDAIYTRKTFVLDGLSLVYGADDNQGMKDVFVTAIRDGKVQPISSLRELGR